MRQAHHRRNFRLRDLYTKIVIEPRGWAAGLSRTLPRLPVRAHETKLSGLLGMYEREVEAGGNQTLKKRPTHMRARAPLPRSLAFLLSRNRLDSLSC